MISLISLFLTPYLRKLGYDKELLLVELAQRAILPVPGGVQMVSPWIRWRGFCLYLGCIEMARAEGYALPTESARITSELEIPAQYHSASLIFFSQALLDNLAAWLSDAVPLVVRGGERNFSSTHFRRELRKRLAGTNDLLEKHDPFIKEVNRFRQAWIHNFSGGAGLYTDGPPNSSESRELIGVPIDPGINLYANTPQYRRRVDQCVSENQGRWIYPIREFVDRIANGTKAVFLDVLRLSLESPIASAPTCAPKGG